MDAGSDDLAAQLYAAIAAEGISSISECTTSGDRLLL